MTRLATTALLTDTNLILLLRLSRIFFARCDVLEFLREEIKSVLNRVYIKLVNDGSGPMVEANEIISTCCSLGFKFLGGGQLQRQSDNDASAIIKAFIADQEKTPILRAFSHWNALKKAYNIDVWSDTVKIRMSFICMRTLLESGRAFFPDSNKDLSVVVNVCIRLDTNTFRLVMSFLGEKSNSKKESSRVLFNRDMTDNFSSELCHGSIAEAVAEGVEEIHEVLDTQTGTSFLHIQAARGRTDDVKALLAMGMDPSIPNGSMWENGDGWGELEFLSFTPLHFAAANGRFDTAKVLLEHGAKVKMSTGWDGGCTIPLTKPGSDYWYTGNSTPLHLAARGNHADIIHLLLGGPSPSAVEAAALRGVDLKETWHIEVDVTGPTETFEDDNGKMFETLPLTPLAVALMFGNLAATKALLKHGASIDKIGTPCGYARQCILDGLMIRSAKCGQYVLKNLAALGATDDEDVAIFLRKYSNLDDEASKHSEKDEDEAYLDDDWDELAVAPDDALAQENEETGTRIVPGLQSAAVIASLQLQVQPNLCLSRNAQYIMDDILHAVLKDLLHILMADNIPLSPEKVEATIITYLKDGQLLKCGLVEANKESGEALLLNFFTEALQQTDLAVTEEREKATIVLAKFVEYLLIEILEIAGNCTKDKHLQVIWPSHIHSAVLADEELRLIFKNFVFSDLIPQNITKGDLEWYLEAYSLGKEGFVKVDEFDQQCLNNSSPFSALQLARAEVDYFTTHVKQGPVMAQSYFKEFWVASRGDALDISNQAAIALQLVVEHHLWQILENARDVANKRIIHTIKTDKALRLFVSESLPEEEVKGEGEEGEETDEVVNNTENSSVADFFSFQSDLCYSDLKSVLK